jgi:hypothetical protein
MTFTLPVTMSASRVPSRRTTAGCSASSGSNPSTRILLPPAGQVHGRVHDKTLADPRFINASCEAQPYRPVRLAELLDGRIAQLSGRNARSGGFRLSPEASNGTLQPVAAPVPPAQPRAAAARVTARRALPVHPCSPPISRTTS